MADRLYTILNGIKNRIIPLTYGGTGANNINGAVNNLKSPLVDLIYPVGSVYTSTKSTNPGTLFGGTWTQIENKFLLGAGDSYTVRAAGGVSTVTLTASEMPSHTHTFTGSSVTLLSAGSHAHNLTARTGSGSTTGFDGRYNNWPSTRKITGVLKAAGSHTHTLTAKGSNSSTGGGGAHNNMPPYLVVYMWRRTA